MNSYKLNSESHDYKAYLDARAKGTDDSSILFYGVAHYRINISKLLTEYVIQENLLINEKMSSPDYSYALGFTSGISILLQNDKLPETIEFKKLLEEYGKEQFYHMDLGDSDTASKMARKYIVDMQKYSLNYYERYIYNGFCEAYFNSIK